MSDNITKHIKRVVAYIQNGTPKLKNDVIIGPVVQRHEDAATSIPPWYFVFVHEDHGEANFISLGADDRKLAQMFRTKLIPALTTAKFVLHDFDDDLALVQMAEAIWPSAKTRRIHQELKAELAENLAQEREEIGVDVLIKERPLNPAEIALFGLDAKAATKFFAIDVEGSTETEYYRVVDVDVDGTRVPVMQRYMPP